MFWALIIVLASSLRAFPATPEAADTAPRSSWQQVSPYDKPSYDAGAERELLDMANADRAQAGKPPLKMDDGLVKAARAHAAEMASRNAISHQFSGEAPLIQRISENSGLHLDREGENVAVASTADDAHQALMASPPHRDNLLSPNFNVAGIGVFRKGNRIYVAQDFGYSLPSYSVKQAEELVAASVEQLRAQVRMPRLQRTNANNPQSSACAMAKADSLNAATPEPGQYMLRYTSMQPETLPAGISKVISQRGLHAYSAGTCYARTQRYPGGAYWVVLVFY
jgi:uncharacterized protein YkwD